MKTTITPSALPSRRGMAATFTSFLALGALLAPPIANAKPDPAGTFPYESFVDNFVSPKSPLTYVPVPDSNGVLPDFLITKGALVLSKQVSGRWSALLKVAHKDTDLSAENTSMRVVARCTEASGVGLWTRDGVCVANLIPVPMIVDGQPVWWSKLRISTWFGLVPQEWLDVDLDMVNNDVVVEFDTIGDTLTLRAWALENPTSVHQISWTGAPPVQPWGNAVLGIGALGFTAPDEESPVVEYYQFKVKIIPPTSNRD